MLTTKNETSQTWPTIATSASAKTIETIASRIGTSEATTAPKTTQQHDQRRRQAEEELALLQVLVRDVEEVVVGGELARDRDLVGTAVGLLDDVDHVLDPVLGVGAHPDREHRRVLVRRDEALVARAVVGRDPVRRSGRLQRRRQPLDLAADLGIDVTSLPGARKRTTSLTKSSERGRSRGHRLVALLRLRVVRHRRVGRDRRRKQQRDGGDRAATKIAPQIASIRFGCSAACRASLSVMPRG